MDLRNNVKSADYLFPSQIKLDGNNEGEGVGFVSPKSLHPDSNQTLANLRSRLQGVLGRSRTCESLSTSVQEPTVIISKRRIVAEWDRQKQLDGVESDESFLRSLLFPDKSESDFADAANLEFSEDNEQQLLNDDIKYDFEDKFNLEISETTDLSAIQFTENEFSYAFCEPDSEVFSELDVEVSGEPDFEVSGEPDLEVSGESDVEVSGEPDVEVCSEPDVEVSGEPEFETSGESDSAEFCEPDRDLERPKIREQFQTSPENERTPDMQSVGLEMDLFSNNDNKSFLDDGVAIIKNCDKKRINLTCEEDFCSDSDLPLPDAGACELDCEVKVKEEKAKAEVEKEQKKEIPKVITVDNSNKPAVDRHLCRLPKGQKLHDGMCTICNKKIGASRMHIHYKRVHNGEMAFSCANCNFKCRRFTALQEHVYGRAFHCRICGLNCGNQRQKKEHMRSEHPDEKWPAPRKQLHDGVCSICNKKCAVTTLHDHFLVEHPDTNKRPFECPNSNCDFDFLRYDHYCDHVKMHSNQLSCESCKLCFSTRCELINHRLKIHELTTRLRLNCKDRRRRAGKKRIRQTKHIGSAYHDGVCNVCHKQFGIVELERHYKLEHGQSKRKAYECKQCDKSYTGYCAFVTHLKNHLIPSRFRCEICDKTFSVKISLTNHYSNHHVLEKFSCEKCGKVFNSNMRLQWHVKYQHGTRNFMCQLCGVVVKNKIQLNRHRLADHTVTFHCDVCGKRLRSAENLKKHKLVLHEHKQVPKNVICDVCGDKFCFPKDLRKHKEKMH